MGIFTKKNTKEPIVANVIRNKKADLETPTNEEIKEKEPQHTRESKKQKKPNTIHKRSRFSRSFIGIIDGSFLTQGNFVRNIPFVFFLSFIAMCYIANTYYSERIIRDTAKTKKQIKELKSEYLTVKSALMDSSRQSKVSRRVAILGIEHSVDPPEKIFIEEDSTKNIKK